MTYSIATIVETLQALYESSCQFFNLVPNQKKRIDLDIFIYQFWKSKKTPKKAQQTLLTIALLIQNLKLKGLEAKEVENSIFFLVKIKACIEVAVEANGTKASKYILMPLGLALLNNLDMGGLFNQEQLSEDKILDLLKNGVLEQVYQNEVNSWVKYNKKYLAPAERSKLTKKDMSIALYLIFNGAISQHYALRVIRETESEIKFVNTLVEGLNQVAFIMFGKNEFKPANIIDDLERRAELVKELSLEFEREGNKKERSEEFYWWKAENYEHNTLHLEQILIILLRRIVKQTLGQGLQSIKLRVEALFNHFRYGLNSYSMHEMTTLFKMNTNTVAGDNYTQVLLALLEKVLNELDQDEDLDE